MPDDTVSFIVTGRVQGVGFRWFVRVQALALGLRGWVRNREDGSVEALAVGRADQLDELEADLRRGPPAARVESVRRRPGPPGSAAEGSGFEIR